MPLHCKFSVKINERHKQYRNHFMPYAYLKACSTWNSPFDWKAFTPLNLFPSKNDLLAKSWGSEWKLDLHETYVVCFFLILPFVSPIMTTTLRKQENFHLNGCALSESFDFHYVQVTDTETTVTVSVTCTQWNVALVVRHVPGIMQRVCTVLCFVVVTC